MSIDRKRYVAGFIVACLVLVGYVLVKRNIDSKLQVSGDLEILETSYDFGVIGLNEVSHEFVIKNIGEGSIDISRVATSCGCTTAQLQKDDYMSVEFGMDHGNLPKPNLTLDAGEEVKVLVVYDPLAHGLDNAAGKFRRIVYIDTANPDKEYELIITMEVNPEKTLVKNPKIEINNGFYDFGKILKDNGIVEATFTIINSGIEDLIINEITTSCGCTSADIDSKILKSGESSELIVKFDPDFHKEPQGKLERTITIFTNDPDNQEFDIKIYAEIIE